VTTIVVQLPDRGSLRGAVAGEVRAEMARAKVRTNHLPHLLGNSQSFWSRRVNGEVALDIDDLGQLAALLGVPITRFFATAPDSGDGNVPPTGPLAQSAELRTFNPGSALAKVLPLRRPHTPRLRVA
jgi:transcriptional regulator with XRE-family HTH domain